MRGKTVKTPERVAEARRLRDEEGLIVREIAVRLGVAPGTITAWLIDPDGSRLRARKDSYAGTCVDCGAPTSGSEGHREEPRCQECANVKRGAEAKVWTREAIVLAIQEWAAVWGEPPAVADWRPWKARHSLRDEERARRAEREIAAGRCPSASKVYDEFGTWTAALRAAGVEARARYGGGGNELRRRAARSSA